MPNWKKVITSGSDANLNHITASGNISSSGHFIGTHKGVGSGVNNRVYFEGDGGAARLASANQSTTYLNFGQNSLGIIANNEDTFNVNDDGLVRVGTIGESHGTKALQVHGDISCSGNIYLEPSSIDNVVFVTTGSSGTDRIRFGIGTAAGETPGKALTVSGSISASGGITAGAITASHITLTHGLDGTDRSGYPGNFYMSSNNVIKTDDSLHIVQALNVNNSKFIVNNAPTGNDVTVTGDMKVTSDITASANISSSGTITMLTASIGGGIFTSASLAAGGGGSFSFEGDQFATDLKIGRDSTDLIDFASADNVIGFRVGNNDEMKLNTTSLQPATSNGLALGAANRQWSDLFLAEGGVINFDNGDVTITQTGNDLAIAGTTGTSFDGNITASNNISASGTIIGSAIQISSEFGTTNPTFTPGTIGTSANFNSSLYITQGSLTLNTGDLTVGGGNLYVGDDGDLQWELMAHNSGLLIRSASTQYMNITDEGNVQIGISSTADSGQKLQVAGDISASGAITSSGFQLLGSGTAELEVDGHITASGNISASNTAGTHTLGGDVTIGGKVYADKVYTDSINGYPNQATLEIGNSSNITHITASGDISSSGNYIGNRQFDKTSNTDATHQGDIVYFGGTTSMDNGKIYHYKSDGTWELADADAAANCDGLLAVALGAASDTNGMLLRGTVTLDHDPGAVGDVLFLATGGTGQATATAPSGNTDIVRVIGYCLDASNGQIWFNPSSTFVEVSA